MLLWVRLYLLSYIGDPYIITPNSVKTLQLQLQKLTSKPIVFSLLDVYLSFQTFKQTNFTKTQVLNSQSVVA